MPAPSPLLRTAVSYLPERVALGLRGASDLPRRVRRQPHEPDFLALPALVGAEAVALDVGANRGQSIRSFRAVLDRANIHSFEPNQALAERLQRRFRRDDVTVHPVGLGAESTSATLYVPVYGRSRFDPWASLSRAEAEAFLVPDSFWRFDPRRARVESTTVEVMPLDAFDLQPDVIKVDVEGGELGVLLGGRQTIERSRPVLVVERPCPEVVELLAGLGYRPGRWDAQGSTLVRGELGTSNTLFLPD